jgi:hypothetical protein
LGDRVVVIDRSAAAFPSPSRHQLRAAHMTDQCFYGSNAPCVST